MKWIKVEDKLPPYGERVLTIVQFLEGKKIKYYKTTYCCCIDGWKLDNSIPAKIIMWAELPPLEQE